MKLSELNLTLRDVDLGGIDAESDKRLGDYFVSTPYVRSVYDGKRTLFLGRKGAGKSAVFAQLDRVLKDAALSETIVIRVTPDQYAWSALRSYTEQGILPEQAHTNAWKLTLAIEIAGTLAASTKSFSGDARTGVKTLQQFMRTNFGTLRPDLLSSATSIVRGLQNLNLSAFGFEVGATLEHPEQPVTPAVIGALFSTLGLVASSVPILIALDRLDDSWDGSQASRSLLVGLLKAVKDINDRLDYGLENAQGIRAVTFLRSDIYDALSFDDKDKHRPTEQNIVWTGKELAEMVQRRLPAHVGLRDIFESGNMRGSIEPFNYMVKRTFLRPREVLQFLNECIEVASPEASEIAKSTIRTAESRYSRWKLDDLKQEYSKVFPDFGVLVEVFRQELLRYESLEQLGALLRRKCPQLIERHGERLLMETLLNASVIGVRLGNAGQARYKSEDLELVLPTSGGVYIHQAVARGLNVREPRKPRPEKKAERRAALEAKLFERMMKALPMQDISWYKRDAKPSHVLRAPDFESCCLALSLPLQVKSDTKSLELPHFIAETRLKSDQIAYIWLRDELTRIVEAEGFTVEGFLRGS
jgi:energy-coupling factor transporter ATP-binding protein EcfA2